VETISSHGSKSVCFVLVRSRTLTKALTTSSVLGLVCVRKGNIRQGGGGQNTDIHRYLCSNVKTSNQTKDEKIIPTPMPSIPVKEALTRIPPLVGAVVLEPAEDDVDVVTETVVVEPLESVDTVDCGLVAVAVAEAVAEPEVGEEPEAEAEPVAEPETGEEPEAEAEGEAGEAGDIVEKTVGALSTVKVGSTPVNPDAVGTATEIPPASHVAAYWSRISCACPIIVWLLGCTASKQFTQVSREASFAEVQMHCGTSEQSMIVT